MRETLADLRLIGQAQQTFIIADGPDGVYVLDQHAAHERVIFDRVFTSRTDQPSDAQMLMLPERATLDAFQHETLVTNRELIEQQGFQLQPLNDLCWQIDALPMPLTAPHCPRPEHVLQRMLDEFAAERLITSPHRAIAATIACHSAARAGDVLDPDHMQAIIQQLAETPEPHRCPPGRPTIVPDPDAAPRAIFQTPLKRRDTPAQIRDAGHHRKDGCIIAPAGKQCYVCGSPYDDY